MNKTHFYFFLCLTVFTFISQNCFAQTAQQLDAEAERVIADFIEKNDLVGRILKDDRTSDSKKYVLLAEIDRLDPFNPVINAARREVYLRNENFEYANPKDYFQYVRQTPDDGYGWNNLAALLTNKGFVEEADQYFARAESLVKDFGYNHYYSRGMAAFQSGNYRQCIESLTKAGAISTEPAVTRWDYIYLSYCYALQNDKANADVHLQKALKSGGAEIQQNVEFKSGAYFSDSNKCDKDGYKMAFKFRDDYRLKQSVSDEKKFAAFRRLITCFPNNIEAVSEGIKFTQSVPDLVYWSKVYQVKSDKIYGRMPDFDKPARKDDIDNYFKGFFQYAKDYYQKREYDKALELTAKFIRESPDRAQALMLRANIFLDMPSPYKILAWREANKLLAAYQYYPPALAIRARVYYEVKRNPEKALAVIADAIKNSLPKNTYELYLTRGRIYFDMKDYAKAVSDFDAALAIDPKSADAAFYKNLAQNPKTDADSAIYARNKENDFKRQLGEIIYSANSSLELFNMRKKNVQTKKEVCEFVSKYLSELHGHQIRLRNLEKSIPSGGNFSEKYKETAATLERNIQDAKAGAQMCGN